MTGRRRRRLARRLGRGRGHVVILRDLGRTSAVAGGRRPAVLGASRNSGSVRGPGGRGRGRGIWRHRRGSEGHHRHCEQQAGHYRDHPHGQHGTAARTARGGMRGGMRGVGQGQARVRQRTVRCGFYPGGDRWGGGAMAHRKTSSLPVRYLFEPTVRVQSRSVKGWKVPKLGARSLSPHGRRPLPSAPGTSSLVTPRSRSRARAPASTSARRTYRAPSRSSRSPASERPTASPPIPRRDSAGTRRPAAPPVPAPPMGTARGVLPRLHAPQGLEFRTRLVGSDARRWVQLTAFETVRRSSDVPHLSHRAHRTSSTLLTRPLFLREGGLRRSWCQRGRHWRGA